MYKRLFCLACLILLLCNVRAQLSVSLQEPPAGIIQRSQLWNVTIVYSGTAPINIIIALSLLDADGNQSLMTATSRPILIANGVRQLKGADVAPVDYAYLSPAFGMSQLPDAFLPVGNYRACYTVYNTSSHAGILTEDCITLEVAPLAPPQLNLPSDSALVETAYPQFSWLPPIPVNLFTNLNYDLLVTEVYPGQNPEAAIQENLPVYTALHVTSIADNYPASNKSLDTGKVYAWRIVAKNGETFAAQSEVWTFSLATRKPDQIIPANGTYLELKRENEAPGTGLIPDNILGVKYYSYDSTHSTTIRFLNEQGEMIKEENKTIRYGNNFMVFTLGQAFIPENTFFVEITDLQMSRYRTSFRISKNNP